MLHVLGTADEALNYDMCESVAVIIDVLRATTTMTVALANGAKEIIAVKSVEEALHLKDSLGENNILLGGERNADKIEGFDLDNSPGSYTVDVVRGKAIVMTTTNGTRAIANTSQAKKRYVASLLNVDDVVAALKGISDDIYIVCSGTEGCFTIEDGLCAGMIVSKLSAVQSIETNDMAVAMQMLYECSADDITKVASRGEHWSRLLAKGYEGDLDLCFSSSAKYKRLEIVDHSVIMSHTCRV